MDKELLLKDLCARLPYGIKVGMGVELDADYPYILLGINPTACGCAEVYIARNGITCVGRLQEIKPYLRPMSSMTEKEEKEYCKFSFEAESIYTGLDYDTPSMDAIDWLNTHHFDYRGLIKKGLAFIYNYELFEGYE